MKFLALAVLIACVVLAAGDDEKKKEWKIKCKGQEADMSATKPYWKDCKPEKTEGGDKKDHHKNFLKTKVCLWTKTGVVTNNVISQEKFHNQTQAMFLGSKLGNDLATAFDACFADEKNTNNLSEENDCKSYEPFWNCLMGIWKTQCKEE